MIHRRAHLLEQLEGKPRASGDDPMDYGDNKPLDE